VKLLRTLRIKTLKIMPDELHLLYGSIEKCAVFEIN